MISTYPIQLYNSGKPNSVSELKRMSPVSKAITNSGSGSKQKKTILFLYRAIRENESKHMLVVDGGVGHGKQMAQIARVVLCVGSAHRE